MPGAAVWSSAAAAGCVPKPAARVAIIDMPDSIFARAFMSAPSKSEPEDPDHAALARVSPDVFHVVRGRAHVGRIVRDDIAGEQVPVATDSRVHRDVLLAVRRPIGDRVADDARAHLEL